LISSLPQTSAGKGKGVVCPGRDDDDVLLLLLLLLFKKGKRKVVTDFSSPPKFALFDSSSLFLQGGENGNVSSRRVLSPRINRLKRISAARRAIREWLFPLPFLGEAAGMEMGISRFGNERRQEEEEEGWGESQTYGGRAKG